MKELEINISFTEEHKELHDLIEKKISKQLDTTKEYTTLEVISAVRIVYMEVLNDCCCSFINCVNKSGDKEGDKEFKIELLMLIQDELTKMVLNNIEAGRL